MGTKGGQSHVEESLAPKELIYNTNHLQCRLKHLHAHITFHYTEVSELSFPGNIQLTIFHFSLLMTLCPVSTKKIYHHSLVSIIQPPDNPRPNIDLYINNEESFPLLPLTTSFICREFYHYWWITEGVSIR